MARNTVFDSMLSFVCMKTTEEELWACTMLLTFHGLLGAISERAGLEQVENSIDRHVSMVYRFFFP
jgi:hypothetical protein